MQLNKTALAALACVALWGIAPAASLAQSAPAEPAKQAEPPKRDEKAVAYEKAVKDLEKSEGAFTLYKRKKELLLELPEEKLSKLFVVQAAFHHGFTEDPAQAGSPIGNNAVDVYRLERRDTAVWLIRPNLTYRWDPSDPLALASSRTMPEAILSDFPIEQTNPETKRVLINITSLLSGDLQQLGMMVTVLGGSQYSLERDKSGVDRIIQSADMTTVRMNNVYRAARAGGDNPLAAMFGMVNHAEDGRSLPLKVTWTLNWRPEKSNYMPRIADPRVGYFTQDFYSVDKFYKRDRTQRYINRWNLVKKSPEAKLSDVVKPIVWTIDPSIPEKYRPAVREGILRWNRAFEAAGYRNAIQVVDAPKNDPDYDHADARRNVIRFTMTESAGYAIALFRTDPFTGEILNASVNIDANYVHYVNQEYLRSAIPSSVALQAGLKIAKQGLTQTGLPSPKDLMLKRDVLRDKALEPEIRRLGWTPFFCNIGAHAMRDMAMAYSIGKANNIAIGSDKFVEEAMADVVAHEVGHCLGLRHNFIASTNLSTAQLGDDSAVKNHQVAASVMDYTPTNMVALLNNKPKSLFNNSIGAYDMFAIDYGYRPVGAQTPEGEKFALGQIAKQSGMQGLAYMSDEDADGVDPFVVRFDLARDPLNYAEKEIVGYKRTRTWAINNLPMPGSSYADRTSLVVGTMSRQLSVAMAATSFITGVVGNRNFKGDIGEKPTLRPVDPAAARQAMKMICGGALAMDSVNLSESVLNNLSLNYEDGSGNQFTAPIRMTLLMSQMMIVMQLLNVEALNQIQENQFKMPNIPSAYTIDEHVRLLATALFGDVPTSTKINSMRRELQSFALESMIEQASQAGLQAEVRRVAADGVDLASAKINSRLRNRMAIDAATQSHLKNLAKMIARYENRMMTVSGP
ncbi:MAG: zinc-dependent metalloprotease [Chthonomonas sp.]|nr:zinc-dependent metalloprotease [Chthonomonas sp.]